MPGDLLVSGGMANPGASDVVVDGTLENEKTVRLDLQKFTSRGENLVEHRFGQPTRKRILLAGMIASK